MSQEFRAFYLGREEEVLFEEPILLEEEQTDSAEIADNARKYYVGYTKEYVKVAKYSETPLDNRIVKGTLTKMINDEIYLME